MTVVGILLTPLASLPVLVIDIIPERLLLASAQVWSLVPEALISPVMVVGHRFRDAHCINETAFASPRFGTSADNPITDYSRLTYLRLTRC